MADGGSVDGNMNIEDFAEVTVLSTGRMFEYVVPNFPVYKATLREVKLQWEEYATETIHSLQKMENGHRL